MINKDQVIEITQEGLEEKKKRLDFLINVERPRNVEAIKDARAQGDLSENADYDAARDEQARIEAEINEIQAIIKYAKIIDTTKTGVISTGKKVKVRFKDGKEMEFMLVGTIEADPLNGKISNMSPLGVALSGKKEGANVHFKSEKGNEVEVTVLSVK